MICEFESRSRPAIAEVSVRLHPAALTSHGLRTMAAPAG